MPHGPNSCPSHLVPEKMCGLPQKDTKRLWMSGLGLNPSANLSLLHHFQLLPQLATAASIPAGVALGCGANYLQALLDSITNPYLGSPSWLHLATRAQPMFLISLPR